jgi:hypothetical protein
MMYNSSARALLILTAVVAFLSHSHRSAAQAGVRPNQGNKIPVTMTSPLSSSVSGTITLTASASGAANVDYWIAGHSIVSGTLPTVPPFTTNVDTKMLWDGPAQVVAIARDSGGNIIGQSLPITLNVANGRKTRVRHLSPDFSKPLSGTISWSVSASDPRGIQAFIYFVDGKQVQLDYVQGDSATHTSSFDTTRLPNGNHNFYVQVVPNINYLDSGHTSFVGTVSNTVRPLELRSSFHDVFLQPGQTVRLTARLAASDGSEQPVTATFSSDKTNIARVTPEGLVTAMTEGVAKVTLSARGKATTTRIVVSSQEGFPHFTRSGQIVWTYQPGKSLWVRTLFNTSGLQLQMNAAMAPTMHAAGVNTISSNFYFNPVDNLRSFPDFASWKSAAGAALDSRLDTIKKAGFCMLGIGDDVQRSPGELNNTLTNPWAADALKYTFSKMAQAGNVVSLEMQDEVGGAQVPDDFRKVMAVLNAAGPHPPVCWPPAGLQGPDVSAAWMGDPKMSDYTSWYWTYPTAWRMAFPWGAGLVQTKIDLDKVAVDRLATVQMNRPKYLLVGAMGPSYLKRVAGGDYQPCQDQLQASGSIPDGITSQILYAAAEGMSGARVYGYDGIPGTNDGLWNDQRLKASIGQGELQTGATPFGSNQLTKDRWTAISNAFRVVQALEPYFLSPQINAVDLGPEVATGGRQAKTGRMLVVINLSDGTKTVKIDLTSYRYSVAKTVTRYHVVGLLSTSETVANDTTQTVTIAPGESILWIFTPSASEQRADAKRPSK